MTSYLDLNWNKRVDPLIGFVEMGCPAEDFHWVLSNAVKIDNGPKNYYSEKMGEVENWNENHLFV